MASFTVDGMGELIAKLQNAELLDEETEKELLFAGGDTLTEELQRATKSSGFELNEYARHIGYTKKVKRDKDGNPYIVVTVAGKNTRGERRATVMMVLNYGRAKKYGEIIGTYFWTKGSRKAEKLVGQKLEKITERKLKERGL